jgi:hypothetical protein
VLDAGQGMPSHTVASGAVKDLGDIRTKPFGG